ncbi:MAG: hypothetical protein IJV46_06865 [Acidaminococcaceae bacterium]|nr:hypothetical protein [Acidaminococcaceae bacterium]
MYDYNKEDMRYYIIATIILLGCLACIWLVHDTGRNHRIQNDTDSAVAAVDGGIDQTKERIESAAGSLSQVEQTVHGAATGIAKSERAAAEIGNGIAECETLIDSCVQRAGRIENILADIEASDRKRAARSSATNLAK